MTRIPDNDDRLHRALADIGPGLPEPRAPAHVRARISTTLDRSECPASRRAPMTHRLRTAALAAAAAAFLVLSTVALVQNQRLRTRLERALATNAPISGAVLPAHRSLPPLVAVRFYHPQCPVASEVAPRFEEMERTHCDRQVLFVSLDISERKEAQSARLAGALDCGFVFACEGSPVRSGMVVLADTRTRQVIKASHDASDLGDLERALDAALLETGG